MIITPQYFQRIQIFSQILLAATHMSPFFFLLLYGLLLNTSICYPFGQLKNNIPKKINKTKHIRLAFLPK